VHAHNVRGGHYGVVDVRTDHETVATAICSVVDGNDVAGLFIVPYGRQR
jgi:hypothetical protein